jgi:ABC-type uncharacterized transport system substrate-binding protein
MNSRVSGALALAAFLAFVSADVCYSHPHVFIQNSLRIVFDQQGLAGVRVKWVFDEFFSSMIADEFDKDHNNELEKSEIIAIENGAFANLIKFNYFSFIRINGKAFTVEYVRDFSASLAGGNLIYSFVIPCHVKATTAFKEFVISQYDPTYYTRVAFAKDRPVSLEEASAFEASYRVSKNMKEAYYYGQVHPVEVILKFKRRHG